MRPGLGSLDPLLLLPSSDSSRHSPSFTGLSMLVTVLSLSHLLFQDSAWPTDRPLSKESTTGKTKAVMETTCYGLNVSSRSQALEPWFPIQHCWEAGLLEVTESWGYCPCEWLMDYHRRGLTIKASSLACWLCLAMWYLSLCYKATKRPSPDAEHMPAPCSWTSQSPEPKVQ